LAGLNSVLGHPIGLKKLGEKEVLIFKLLIFFDLFEQQSSLVDFFYCPAHESRLLCVEVCSGDLIRRQPVQSEGLAASIVEMKIRKEYSGSMVKGFNDGGVKIPRLQTLLFRPSVCTGCRECAIMEQDEQAKINAQP